MLVHRGRWRRYPVSRDGQAASRREQWTRSPECLAGAGYLELLRHCVTTTGASSSSANRGDVAELQCGRGRECNLHTPAAVDRVPFVLWSGIGRMCVGCGRAT